MRAKDLAKYDVVQHRPTHVSYRGLDVYGMAPSSSGGTTVGEALNILERYDLKSMTPVQVLHLDLEAAHLAFADRGKYVGDQSGVPGRHPALRPVRRRAGLPDQPAAAFVPPVAAGDVASYDGSCATPSSKGEVAAGHRERQHHQPHRRRQVTATSSSTRSPSSRPAARGSCVPGRGFLLNNELTDFSAVYDPADPNRIEPAQAAAQLDVADDRAQARSRCSRSGRPAARRSSPRCSRSWSTGSTSGCPWPTRDRRAAGGAAQQRDPCRPSRPTSTTTAPRSTRSATTLTPVGAPGTSAARRSARPPAIEFGPGRRLTAAAEPTRRGGGAAAVVKPQMRGAAGSTAVGVTHRRAARPPTWTEIDDRRRARRPARRAARARRQQGPPGAARRRPRLARRHRRSA